jgi:hypothetical protein
MRAAVSSGTAAATCRHWGGVQAISCAAAAKIRHRLHELRGCAIRSAGETPIYGPDWQYQGSVFDYGKTQTYTDRNGQFTGFRGQQRKRH